MTQRAIVSTFLKIVDYTTIQQLPAAAARGRSARANRTTGHNASHPAQNRRSQPRGNAGPRGWQHFQRHDLDSSAAEMAANARGNTSI